MVFRHDKKKYKYVNRLVIRKRKPIEYHLISKIALGDNLIIAVGTSILLFEMGTILKQDLLLEINIKIIKIQNSNIKNKIRS